MKNKKLTALILCITMLFSITSGIFSAAFASDGTTDSAYSLDTTTGSAYKVDKGPMLFSTKAKTVELEEETPTPDYSYVIGEKAAFNMDYDYIFYIEDIPDTKIDYDNKNTAYYDDPYDPPLVEITNWYYDTTGSALWYQVKPLAGETLPVAIDEEGNEKSITEDNWILQENSGFDYQALIITDVSIIGKTVAFKDATATLYDGIDGIAAGVDGSSFGNMIVEDLYTNGVDTWYYVDAVEGETWPTDCAGYHYVKANMVEVVEQEEEDESTNPCAICGETNCKTAHLYCEICEAFDCGQTHVYENPYEPITAPVIPTNPELTEGADVSIVDAEGNAVTEEGLYLLAGEKTSISAWSNLENAEDVSYQWQICYDTDNDLWADIQGQTGKGILISPAMVQSVLDASGTAIIRCEIILDDTVQYSTNIPVTVWSDTQMMARFNLARNMENVEGYAENPEQIQYSIIINYIFENGVTVANPYIAALAANSDFNEKITFPIIQGYLPYLDNVQKNSLDLNITSIDQGYTYTVVYKPTEVDYTIIHYKQNADNDNYTMVLQETKQAKTGTVLKTINDTAMTADEKIENVYEGFYALLFDDSAKIAADGSTVVKVYYDRYYYLINFVLDSGGYGTEPIYARYGATIGNVTTPTRAGYTFDGWTPSIPAIMPLNGATYTANWTAIQGEGGFTVVYWLQDPDPIKDTDGNIVTDEKGDPTYGYQFWGATAKKAADPGTVINGTAYEDYTEIASQLGTYEKRYSTYSHADTNVTVKGDGSTTVNVYYNRKDYTLKFYYAMSSGSGDTAKYYVVGGTTYYFGESANTDAQNDEVKLIDQYMGTKIEALNQRGQVKTMPTLNARGKARDYVIGSDTSTVNNITYQYHYISFTAKYGADISELWPCAVFDSVERSTANTHGNWSGTTAFVSAWNGEHHVLYTQDGAINNGNQTVKGNYTELDYKLLWDYNNFGDNGTVAYLCFWENGADVSWSVPKLFRYNIYVEAFNGQDLTGETTKQYNGKTYYRIDTYDTVDDSEVAKQTATAIKGYTYVARDSDEIILTEEEKKLYVEGYDVNFYYARLSYDLTLNNYGAITTVKKQFGEDISSYAAMPAYPTGKIEADGYEFGGWYTTENFLEGTRYTFTTMPENKLMLYAYWVPKEYTVRFYEKEGATNPIATYTANFHGRTIPEACGDGYVAPDYTTTDSYKDGLTFIGWFYRDEQGIEKAFDLNNSLVMQAMNLYAKWSSNVLKSYTVYYKLRDSDTEIAAPETGTLLAGTTKTFDAKGGTELYAGYQEGYFPLATSHSLTIDIKDDANNTYTFWYKPVNKVPYSVYYVTENPKDGTTLPTITLHGKTYYVVKNTYTDYENKKAVVTADFEAVDGYIPDAYQKRLVVDADNEDNNIIVFVYTVNETQAYYKITHYIEGMSDDTWTEYASSQVLGTIEKTYTAEPMAITGFTYNASKSVTEGTLAAGGLELELYYTRNVYPYEIRYLEQYTEKTLTEATTGTAKYGRTFTGTAKTIENYTVVGESTQTKTILIEDGNDAKLNIIMFYYAENEATINYVVVGPDGCGTVTPESETVKVASATNAVGATATANTNYRFVGWYDKPECTGDALSTVAYFKPSKPGDVWKDKTYYAKFELDVADLTITKSGWESIDENQSFLFTVTGPNGFTLDVVIHGNDSVTIKDLLVGTYTITEKTNWSWRYHPLGDTTKSITLTAGGSNIVEYGNSRSKLYWLDGSAWRDFHNGKSTGSPSTAVISIAFADVILRDDELEQDNLEVQVA